MTRPTAPVTRAALVFATAAMVALAAAIASGCSSTKATECDLNACDNGARFQRNLQVTGADIPKLSIAFCRNSVCQTLLPVVQSDGSYNCTSTPAGSTCLITQDQDTGWSVTVSTATSIATPKDGDVWSVTINETGKTGSLFTVTNNVTYDAQYPNGTDCGPACETAIIK